MSKHMSHNASARREFIKLALAGTTIAGVAAVLRVPPALAQKVVGENVPQQAVDTLLAGWPEKQQGVAKQIIDSGKLGKIFHYRANFLQDWTISADLPQGGTALWRLDVAAAGSGVTGDLLAHCIDTAIWLNGGIGSVSAMTETFIKERKHNLTGKVEKVGIDDACAFLCRFTNGSLGLFESTRYARGHKALYTLEINGEKASIKWDLHDLHRLQYFDHRDEGPLRGWRSIHVTDGDHPYMGKWWVPGLAVGYETSFVHQVADFLKNLEDGKPTSPTFREALATAAVCDAVLDSAEQRKWRTSSRPDRQRGRTHIILPHRSTREPR